MAALEGPKMDLADWQTDHTAPPPRFEGSQDGGGFGSGGTSFGNVAGTHHRPDLQSDRKSHTELLTQTIEKEVIPRLLRARRAASASEALRKAASWQPDSGEVMQFARMTIDRDETLAPTYLQTLADHGVPIETIYNVLLTQAAVLLGAMWDEDEVDFTAVTTGVWRMQQMLRALSAAFVGHVANQPPGRRILLVSAIGEQHSFGVAMVCEYFRRDGWEVCSERVESDEDLAVILRGSWFDMLGISVGGSTHLESLTKSIQTSRRASRNLQLGVMVGGPVFVAHPELVSQVGADATAADAAQATIQADRLMTLLARHG